MVLLSVLFGVGCACVLGALCYFVLVLVFNGWSLPCHLLEAKAGPIPWPVALTFGLGVLVCVYSGAHRLLWWIPAQLGTFGEYGEFVSTRGGIAGLCCFLVGGPLAAMLLGGPRDRYLLDLCREEAAELTKILEAQSRARLEAMWQGYESKLEEARALAPKPRALHRVGVYRRVELFEFLIQKAKARAVELDRGAQPTK